MKQPQPQPNPARATRATARSRWVGAAFACACAALIAPSALAQQVQVQMDRGPHYEGEAVEIRIAAEGFAESPSPQIEVAEPARGTLSYLGASPNVQSSITIINGQLRRTRKVSIVFRFRFTAPGHGRFQLGPFTVRQEGVARSTPAIEVALRGVPTTDRLRLLTELPRDAVFVGQKLPIKIELWLERALQDNLHEYVLRVPLFDSPAVRFLDDPSQGDTQLEFQTAAGAIKLPGSSREETYQGKRYLVVSVSRTLMPREAGRIEAAAPTVVVSEATRWRRDFFGSRQASAVRKLKAVGEALSLEIAQVPAEGRPSSFAGAIGRGFALEVSADRTVVQAGEPVVLTFSLRGDGDLRTAALPPLDAPGLLDPTQFRVPEEPPTGTIDGATKEFSAIIRVLDDAVREIPALEYSWFDAATRRFETTRSRPIALSVRPAEVIGASDVQGLARAPLPHSESGANSRPADAGRTHSFALTGADLGVERDSSLLLRNEHSGRNAWGATLGLHGLGLALVAVAWLDRRRRDVDPERVRRDSELAEAMRAIDAASGRPEREAAETMGRGLRSMLATVPAAANRELDSLLGELDSRSYAPGPARLEGSGDDEARLPDALSAQVATAARSILELSASTELAVGPETSG